MPNPSERNQRVLPGFRKGRGAAQRGSSYLRTKLSALFCCFSCGHRVSAFGSISGHFAKTFNEATFNPQRPPDCVVSLARMLKQGAAKNH